MATWAPLITLLHLISFVSWFLNLPLNSAHVVSVVTVGASLPCIDERTRIVKPVSLSAVETKHLFCINVLSLSVVHQNDLLHFRWGCLILSVLPAVISFCFPSSLVLSFFLVIFLLRVYSPEICLRHVSL